VARVVCLIDGFNLYHVIHACHPTYCKWCNYRILANHFVRPKDELVDVYYFTALAKWDNGKVARHALFIKALEFYGVKVILGNFKTKYPKCRNCHQTYPVPEEKESDVNLAIKLVSGAYEDEYDKALIVSADSDFVSAIKMVKQRFPAKIIGSLIPFNNAKPHIGRHMRQSADFTRNIERGHFLSSRLPNKIALADGETISCPQEYSLPLSR
jgi:uncharacterized LabA/DUF88 family protein